MNIRDALTRSINIIAVKVLIDIGFEPTIKLAHDMGIKSQLNPNYSLALGSNEVNLLELTSAYGTFATNGLHVEPHGIRRILNRRGEVIWSADFKPERAIDAESAAIMTWMLRNVVVEGTGRGAQIGRPVAGKTGTSDEARDLWFIGYIPQLVTGVWLGNDNNNPTDGSSGSAASTWHNFMEEAVKGMAALKFPAAPKLEGRKGTIKAQAVKTKRIINRSISSYDQDDNSEEQNYSRSRRRRYRQQESSDGDGDRSSYRRRSSSYTTQEQSQEETPRRRRRSYYQQQDWERPRRRYRRQNTEESSSRRSESSSESYRPRRRYRRVESDSSRQVESNYSRPTRRRQYSPPSRDTSTSSGSSSTQRSWRERLRPSSSESGTESN